MEVPDGFGTLATGASHFQIQVVGGVLHAIHASDQTDPGKVEHEGKANPGADIGGASGQVPQLFIEGEAQVFIQQAFAPFGIGPRQRQSSGQSVTLDSKMVLFVDHDGETGIFSVAGQAVGAGLQELGTDQVPLQQHLSFCRRGGFGIKPMESKFGKSSQGRSDAVANANLFFTVGSIDEGFA